MSHEVAVLGSTGYAGQELVSILAAHNEVENIQTPSRDELSEFEGSETVFLALPHGEAGKQAALFRRIGCTVIDLSGDLRFPTQREYERWYGQAHPAPELLPAPYALPERNRDKLPNSELVSMPGCYPTATLLGLLPLIDKGLIQDYPAITVTANSGISGRGKKPAEGTHAMNVLNNISPYNTGRKHRHVGEIEQFLDGRAIFFSPSTVGFEQGMLVQSSAQLTNGTTPEEVHAALQEAYEAEPFVQVVPEGLPDVKEAAGTDECHVGAVVESDIGTVVVGSSLDNLRKGAASQAVQAFNLIYGFPETTSLRPKVGWQ